MAAKTKKPETNAMDSLQSAVDALENRLPHLAHLGGKQQQEAHDYLRRAKVLLNPEEPLALAKAMNGVSVELDGLVVDAVLFTHLPPVRVLLYCVVQDRVTNLFCRFTFLLTDNSFDLQPVLFLAAVINPI